MRLTETSRAREFAKPPESIKTAGEEIQFDVRLSLFFVAAVASRNERRRATFFLALVDRLNFMLYRETCVSAVVETQILHRQARPKVARLLGAFHYANSRGC
jgi:hypothetical protein